MKILLMGWVLLSVIGLEIPKALAHSDHSEDAGLSDGLSLDSAGTGSEYGMGDQDENIYLQDGDGETGKADLGLSRNELTGGAMTSQESPSMDHQHQENPDHSGHQMPDIKISEHEWIGASKKGYGIAVGFTLFAGSVFGLLHILWPKT